MNPAVRFARPSAAGLTLLAGLALLAPRAGADEWKPRLAGGVLRHANVSHAADPIDEVPATEIRADLETGQRYQLGRDDSCHVALDFAGSGWIRHRKLATASAGGRAAWRHKFGVSAVSPVFSLEAAAEGLLAREPGRSGPGAGVTAALRKRFDNLTTGTVAHEVAWHDARDATFDRAGGETRLELERDLTDLTRLTVAIRHREGDVVAYASAARPELAARARSLSPMNTFDRPMTAWRFAAGTWSARVALLHSLTERSALTVAYEWRETARHALRFRHDTLSLTLIRQF